MKEKLKELGYWFEGKLKELCGEITPDKRLTVILIMLLLFTIMNLYFTFTTISNWGRNREREKWLKMEHIDGLKLQKEKSLQDLIDSPIEGLEDDSIFYNPKNENV